MVKYILIGGLGGFLGYQLGAFVTKRRQPPQEPENEAVPVARMARDFRQMSRDLDPLLASIEAAYADGRLSVQDMYRIGARAEALL